jgi:hypothetical protein
MSSENTIDGGYYYDLWKFFNDEHNLILVDTEINDIIHAVRAFDKKRYTPPQRDLNIPKDDQSYFRNRWPEDPTTLNRQQ